MTSELWTRVWPPAFARSLRWRVALAEKLLPMVSRRTVLGSPARMLTAARSRGGENPGGQTVGSAGHGLMFRRPP
jgi:hypothetical protein